MNAWADKAIEKIGRERKETKGLGRAGLVMAGAVADKLCDFCGQDEKFSMGVLEGGSFLDCMKAVEKNCGSALSDPEAYRRAVQFYFPNARIYATMTIDTGGQTTPETKQTRGVVLDLLDFL